MSFSITILDKYDGQTLTEGDEVEVVIEIENEDDTFPYSDDISIRILDSGGLVERKVVDGYTLEPGETDEYIFNWNIFDDDTYGPGEFELKVECSTDQDRDEFIIEASSFFHIEDVEYSDLDENDNWFWDVEFIVQNYGSVTNELATDLNIYENGNLLFNLEGDLINLETGSRWVIYYNVNLEGEGFNKGEDYDFELTNDDYTYEGEFRVLTEADVNMTEFFIRPETPVLHGEEIELVSTIENSGESYSDESFKYQVYNQDREEYTHIYSEDFRIEGEDTIEIVCPIITDYFEMSHEYILYADFVSTDPTQTETLFFSGDDLIDNYEDVRILIRRPSYKTEEGRYIDLEEPYKVEIKFYDGPFRFDNKYEFEINELFSVQEDYFSIELPEEFHLEDLISHPHKWIFLDISIIPFKKYERLDYDEKHQRINFVTDFPEIRDNVIVSSRRKHPKLESLDDIDTDSVYFYWVTWPILEQTDYIIPPYLTPERDTNIGESEFIEKDIEFKSNKHLMIYEMFGNKKVSGIFTSEVGLTLSSEIMQIENTEFIEHILNEQDTIEITMKIGDEWDGAEIVRHRDLEKHNLRYMYENNSLLSLACNITSDISHASVEGDEPSWHSEEAEENITDDDNTNLQIMSYLMIEALEIQQSGESANTYDVSLTLKRLDVNEVTEEDYKYRKPLDLGLHKSGEFLDEKIRYALRSDDESRGEYRDLPPQEVRFKKWLKDVLIPGRSVLEDYND